MGTKLLEDPGSDPARRSKTTLVDSSAGKTRLVAPVTSAAGASAPAASALATDDPVVGWLVVTTGPGKGTSVPLGHGMNSIGRGASNRIVIGFGDDQISSEDHFRIAYDQENRSFHLVPGTGTNLVYLGSKALLAPTMLEPLTDIRVGATTLRFVPLCGQSWDWSDV